MSYTCPTCKSTSTNPLDEKFKYCTNCKVFEDDAALRAAVARILPTPESIVAANEDHCGEKA
jgi:hypothetical protein